MLNALRPWRGRTAASLLPDPATMAPGECRNCGAVLPEPTPGFCPACGQGTTVKPPRLTEFIQQFGGAYLATEGAMWRTLKLLLTKPGELTRLYLAGRRKHYVLPLRLYLTISLVTLLAVRLTGGVQVEVSNSGPIALPEKAQITIGGGRAGMKDGVFYCDDLPQWICRRIQRRIDLDPKAMAREIDEVKQRFVANMGAAMFVLLPGFALWLKLAYLNRRLRYTEHLVFALHVHAFWFVALALAIPDRLWLSTPAFIAVPVYTLMAMRRVYGGRRWLRLLRAGFVSVLYGVTLAFAMGGLGLWVFFT